jgi:putative ABC transport system permease protein
MRGLLQDWRYSLRQLGKNPGFTAVTVLTLAVGIGANTAMFSIVYGVLLRALPFRDSGALYTMWERNTKMGYEQNLPAAANFRDWRDRNHVFGKMAAFNASASFDLSGGSRPERVDGAAVSPGLFELLGVAPSLGRTFSSHEDELGRERVVILSHGLWQRRFNADTSIVGKSIPIDGRDFTVIGVMPGGFQFPGDTGTVMNIFTAPPAQLWVPLALTPHAWNERSAHYLEVIGRLRPGVTLDRARQEMNSIQHDLDREYPQEYIGTDLKLIPLHEQVVGRFRTALLVLFGAVAFVLLIGCANVSNLQLTRATSRRLEIAVRSALGANRARIVKQLLTESLLIAVLGGILGIITAFWGIQLLRTILPANFPRTENIQISTPALTFTALVSFVTSVIFGLVPAFYSTKGPLIASLKEGGRAVEGIGRDRLRNALVVAEVALALILLVGTGLLLRSFFRLQAVDPGFEPDNVLTMEISLPDSRYPDPRKAAFFAELLDRIRSLPGVRSAGAIGHLPLGGDMESYAMQVEGRAELPNEYANPSNHVVMPGYFESIGVPLLEGRLFDQHDNAQSPHVLIVNDVVARNVFPSENPIGKHLRLGFNGFSGEIVGVVRHTSHLNLDTAPSEEVYASFLQAPFWNSLSLTVRTDSNPLAVAQPIREIVHAIDSNEPISKMQTMNQVLDAALDVPRFRTLLLGLFGVTALLLGAIGIYGVMSYSVRRRTQEIGLRMALGAAKPEVVSMILKQGLRLVIAGAGIGLIGAMVLTRLLSTMLFAVQPTDPLTFAGVTVLLIGVAISANLLPARRAAKVDPMVALRYE